MPAHALDAVVLCPRGAHPSYAQGYYDRDCAFYRRWTAISKDPQQLRTWLKEWVLTTTDHAEYLEKLGEDYWADLEVAPRPSGTVDYGSRK